MQPDLALLICSGGVAGLLCLTDKLLGQGGRALWIPILWVVIIATRPISLWFGAGQVVPSAEQALDGSPFDRSIFAGLMLCGICVLGRRSFSWSEFFARNKWLCVFFAYLALSVLWSPYPFVSLKRLIKDFGNVIMAVVILTERNPADAVRILVARVCFIVIPFSVLVVKYFPEVGRYYDQWTGVQSISALAPDKNMLGMSLVAMGLGLIWLLQETGGVMDARAKRKRTVILGMLLLANLWLLKKANSSTALACFLLGVFVLLELKNRYFRRRVKQFATCAILIALAVVAASRTDVFSMLGRDATMTGRTDIWRAVLSEEINPILGEGFYSFWMGNRADRLSAEYHYELNEAHNGYIETYLNSGLVGVILLAGLLIASAWRLTHNRRGVGASFKAACLIIALPYGITESVFNRLNLVWFFLLLALTDVPVRQRVREKRFAPQSTLRRDEVSGRQVNAFSGAGVAHTNIGPL